MRSFITVFLIAYSLTAHTTYAKSGSGSMTCKGQINDVNITIGVDHFSDSVQAGAYSVVVERHTYQQTDAGRFQTILDNIEKVGGEFQLQQLSKQKPVQSITTRARNVCEPETFHQVSVVQLSLKVRGLINGKAWFLCALDSYGPSDSSEDCEQRIRQQK